MTSTSSVNYKCSYFENPVLTTIRGEPTYETLHHLKNELKAKSSSVPTTLGGGNHVYLGTILTPAEYRRIAPTDPFTRPPNTGVLVPNPVGTAAQIASAENNHRLTKKLYLETLLLERNFIQQIIEAIETKYLAALCNPITGKITPLVPTILEFLHNNYGRITPHKLDEKTTTIKTMIYNPDQPIDIILNSIDDLVEYERAAELELTQSQTINLTLVILNRQQIFKDDIRAWKRTNQAYKMWDNFKLDFREAHLELRETGGIIYELGFYNANAIVDQMMARLQVYKDECTATATQHATKLASANQANATMESPIQTLLAQV